MKKITYIITTIVLIISAFVTSSSMSASAAICRTAPDENGEIWEYSIGTPPVDTSDTSIFCIGTGIEEDVPTATELVKAALKIEVCEKNNKDLEVNDSTKMEFVNQFGYCETQLVYTVESDFWSKVLIFRPYDDGGCCVIYTFFKDGYDNERSYERICGFDDYNGKHYVVYSDGERFYIDLDHIYD